MKIICYTFILCLLCSCSVSNQLMNNGLWDYSDKKVYKMFVGKNEDYIFRKFGEPSRYKDNANGNRIMIYEPTKSYTTKDELGNNITTYRTDPDSFIYFYLDKDGIVTDWNTNDPSFFRKRIGVMLKK